MQPVSVSARVAAVVAALVGVACTLSGVWFDAVAPSPPEGFGSATATAAAGLAMALPGALLLWRLGWHPIAVVLTLAGVLWSLDGPAAGLVNLALATGDATPLTSWGFWYWARFGAVLLVPVQLILVLFPDGRLPRGRWRGVSIVSLVLAAFMPLVFLLAPASALAADERARTDTLDRFDPGAPALPIPQGVWEVLLALTFPVALVSAALALAVTISRRRGASTEQRAQLRWLIWAAIVFVALLLLSRVLPSEVGDVAFALAIAALSGAIVVAVMRHGLYAIDRLLSWTILYALLVASVLVVDVAVYLVVGTVFDDRVTTLVAVLIVVAAYTPLRDRLFRLVSRWVNGTRGDPYDVVSALADRLDAAGTTESQLGELARSISQAFASSYVHVELDRPDGTTVSADAGGRAAETVELPLVYQGRPIGRIRMQPGRRPAVSPRDRRLLGDLVRLAAAAIRNADLSRELQTIREGLVTAREEERSRLRRELHDGLGPLLGGIRLRLETARNLAPRDPDRSLAALDTAIDESRLVVDEIRSLVHDLRPPALDDLGLVRAIGQQADRLASPALTVVVEADDLPPLGAAVEVAAYRIASEALTNVVKHSGARAATVRLRTQPDALVVEVEDDGVGMDPRRTAGVGLVSLRTRASELGGRMDLLPGAPGTLVRAVLPRTEPADAAV